MKTASIISVTLGLVLSGAFVLFASIAYASEVTGQLSSNSFGSSGSQVSGTFGGGSSTALSSNSGSGSGGGGGGGGSSGSLSGSVSGSVSGGSVGGGGGGGGIPSLLSNGSVGAGTGQVGIAPGEVLGASTEVPSTGSLTNDSGSIASQTQGDVAIGNTSGAVAQGNAPLTAAVAASGIGMSWWLWIVLLLLLVAAGAYTYWRYRKERH